MRYRASILRLQSDARYPAARELLEHLVSGTPPDRRLLAVLYPYHNAESLLALIKSTLTSPRPPIRRQHVREASTEISDARQRLEQDKRFAKIQTALLAWAAPRVEDIEEVFLSHSVAVSRAIDEYLRSGLRRQCGLPRIAHAHRVAGVVRMVEMDAGRSADYCSIALLHDVIEDLLSLTNDGEGKPFGLSRYEEFVESRIPASLCTGVKLLTNDYDLILKHARDLLHKQERAMTKANLIETLHGVKGNCPSALILATSRLLEALNGLKSGPSVYEEAKWLAYRDLYINDLAIAAQRADDYRIFQIKAVDLSDNSHGQDALPTKGKIRNILKMGIWASKGYQLRSTWPPLNNFVMELFEDALVLAEYLVMRDLLELESTTDFLSSALLKIEELRSVLYID